MGIFLDACEAPAFVGLEEGALSAREVGADAPGLTLDLFGFLGDALGTEGLAAG